ncbi:MAG TPA: LLM class flavin-dependent oxidoreductase [Acidimicrobiales bacterium]|nr:LLM class flavin-dependent oxidoreductase [Acidimicrobiales bacterium]
MKIRFALSVGTGPPDAAALASVCRLAESRGFDTLWFSDVPTLPLTDPLVGVAFAAGVTERVHLGVNLIPFGSTPYLVAHRLAQLDRLSGGRLLVTLVPGLDPPYPGRMVDEVIPELRALWSGGLPVPPVQDPLEIWLGGSGPKAVERAGRLADGWLGSLVSPRRAGQVRAGIQEAAAAAGRTVDPEHFGLSIGYARDAAGVEAAARSRLRALRSRRPDLDPGVDPSDLVPVGADALRRLIGELAGEGLSKFVVRPVGPVADWDEELAWLAGTLLDLQT